MKILIDTQALFWWYGDPGRLSQSARSIIQQRDDVIFVSAVTAWELAIKVNTGKLDALSLVIDFRSFLIAEGFTDLPITVEHAARAGLLPLHHKDPFDRLLVAQAQEIGIPIVSNDQLFDRYDVKRLW